MPSTSIPDSLVGRLRWALGESLVVAGIFAFWILLAAALNTALGILTRVLAALNVHAIYVVDDLAVLWPTVVPLAFVTAVLYAVVRAGTLLIDQYRNE
ncbi:hypothetical protein [Salarchaeum sp. JOR-1]|uniref:hypothetical protein n=1 Tax=Salarchaeum sp. JOR-1 TaxID=2599399 RepID=UPI0011987FD5|nr:hypothetical protein [Salarchaeum sp. JOR-1]QDX39639.1 hypothetical protein FQU85_01545 [Salarchaeum sp. JOR-1]